MNWNKISLILGCIVSIILIIGGFVGAQQYFEGKYARAEAVSTLKVAMEYTNKRLEQKIIQDRIDRKQDIKDRLEIKVTVEQDNDNKLIIKEQIQQIDRDIEVLERDLENIDKLEKVE